VPAEPEPEPASPPGGTVGRPASCEVQIWTAAVPLAVPVATPAGRFDTYHHLVVLARDADGRSGWGLAAGVTAAEVDATADRAGRLLDEVGTTIDGLVAAEDVPLSAGAGLPDDRWSRWAACAVATAGWDLRARQLGVSCAELWAPERRTTELPAYASGLFLSTPTEQLVDEAARYRREGFRLVKMRTGLDVPTDLERLGAVRQHFPEPGCVAVDTVNAWSPDQATAFAEAAGPLLWIEDPVPLDQLPAVDAGPTPVAAGESLTTQDELLALWRAGGVGAVLLDVQQIGGPRRFLAAAGRLAAEGARIGAHVFTPVSTQLLACVEDPLPVEVFDWSDPLWSVAPRPGADGSLPVAGPGLGTTVDLDALGRLGRLVAGDRRRR
jgi:L-alanine-DL-glutamate epimerase-like enolase superfamily enzyme